ncbi:hypothetical protein [Phenylobacterium sp.]|uniref:COG4705 family protein n=1 Tax=Phenylobacterium sp. TaxID=1871053 RepID=UPI00286C1756|nr:hypothetical protein [Phenylobacterium sp.]
MAPTTPGSDLRSWNPRGLAGLKHVRSITLAMRRHALEGEPSVRMLNKVPAVTLIFWLIKTMATTVGETAADFLSTTLHLGLIVTSYVMGALLLLALAVQLMTRRYWPMAYWVVVVLVSVVGTLISDNLVDNLGVSLIVTSVIFGAGLAAVFVTWYASERTLSVHTIVTTRREIFYWAAILLTFSLGTSAGDLIAEKLGLGYAYSVVLFLALIAAVAGAYYVFKINAVLAFWIAYILTRPLGASTGDLLSQPAKLGGLGLGTTWTSLLFLLAIVSLAGYLALRQRRETADVALPATVGERP